MIGNISKTVCIFFLALFMATTLFAQRQTGTIMGTVVDDQGISLPGVGVTVKSTALIIPELSTISNEQGIFRLPALPPGTYSATFVLDGMNTLIREGITVSAGQTVTLDVTLQLKTLEEAITVVGENPLIDQQSSTLTTQMNSEFLKSVPAGRDLGSYIEMAPGMTRNEGYDWRFQNPTAMGTFARENRFELDGLNLMDPQLGIQQIEFGMDVMSEVSVMSGGLAAEFGNVSGAVVNVVSKSGGNKFSGSATFYYSSDSLQSVNTTGTDLEGSKSGFKSNIEPSFTFGGPVVKDKLWFFLAGSYIQRAEWVPGFPSDKEEDVPVHRNTPYAFGKLSFQPDKDNRFVFGYNYSSQRLDNMMAGPTATERSTAILDYPAHSLNLTWTHFFSGNFFMDFRGNYVNHNMNFSPKDDNDPGILDILTRVSSGTIGFYRQERTRRFDFELDGTLFADNLAGSHEFKAGVEYQRASVNREWWPSHESGLSSVVTLGGIPYIGTELLAFDAKDQSSSIHFYLQDTWSLSKRITINIGARLAHQRLTIPQQNEDEGDVTIGPWTFNRSVTESFTPLKWTDLDPRVGLIFDVTGDGKTLFKASYSKYTSPLLTLNAPNFNPNYYVYVQWFMSPTGSPLIPFNIVLPSTSKTSYNGKEVSAPYTHGFSISLERDVTENWAVSIRWHRKLTRNLYFNIDADQLDLDRLMNNGELVWTNWAQVPFTDPFDSQQKYFWSKQGFTLGDFYILNVPGTDRDYDAVELSLVKKYSDGWSLIATYTWGKARGFVDTSIFADTVYSNFFQDPNAHVNAQGRIEMDRRHSFKLQGLFRAPWGINFSGFIRYLSGFRYTRNVNSFQLGVPVSPLAGPYGASIFAETRGSQGNPDRLTVDLRLEKVFQINTVSFSVFADAFNLFNSNKALELSSSSSNLLIPYQTMLRIENPRTFRLGARIIF